MNNFEFELEMTKIKSLNRILKSGTEMKSKLIIDVINEFEKNQTQYCIYIRILLKTVVFCTKL